MPLAGDVAEFTPYVPDDTDLPELTIPALLLGVVLGLVFAASSVYLALKIGLTVSASIPIAVLSITIFRWITQLTRGRQSILRNNIVQTTGSAGESIAAGTVFTLPALLLLGYSLPWTQVAAIALVGGLLGVLLMVPLRRSLIVDEHRNLKYPEGTACAEVLIAGEEGGTQAKTVFAGFAIGAIYKFINAGMHVWAEVPKKTFQRLLPTGRTELFGEIQAEVSPELAGVGFIIGPRIAGLLFAGGMLSFFVLIPAIKFFGAGLTTAIAPAAPGKLIGDMSAMEIRANYVYYIGAGAVTAAGLVSLGRALPTILGALVGGFRRGGRAAKAAVAAEGGVPRRQRDLPMSVVAIGSLLLVAAMVVLPQIGINVFGAILALFFAFLFVVVSSRITGQIGASANPISGMTVATVLLTALIFLAVGWTGVEHRVLALSIGGVVCVAAAVAGATSQDLKTGYLVGATPARQQVSLVVGVVTSALLIGFTIQALDRASTTYVKRDYPGLTLSAIDAGRYALNGDRLEESATGQYRVGHLYEQTGAAPAGRYLIDDAGAVRFLVDPGIGGTEVTSYTGKTVRKLDSPKAQIMRLVVDGILTQKLSWGLIMIGAFLTIALEILGVPSLPVAVGVYLPISTSATMFMGGVVRWLAERSMTPEQRSGPAADSGPGVLLSSGLIAGGAITGIALAALAARDLTGGIDMEKSLGAFAASPLVAFIAFLVLVATPLYLTARKGTAVE
ncbi:MAG TPA: oligopeptide transporter, OPT family [Gemmatimonadaceae bacterium]|nr:oligopeptide transporter, OPT family [Gemmatimonadaceae bacterium]